MGICCGKQLRYKQDNQLQHWRSTGIIGCRDQLLKEVPTKVLELQEIAKVLDLSNNKLKCIDDRIDVLCALQRLVLTNNCLVSISRSVASLTNLKVLLLDLNQIDDIPDSLGSLTKLEKFSVYSNRLTSLPDSIGNLSSLQILNIGRNNLSALPDSLGNCSSLEELDANNNAIITIPASLGQLEKLKILNLDSNRISTVPSAVFHGCVSLQTLSLHGNPITGDAVQSIDGFNLFEERRRSKYSKAIHGGVLLDSKGMDEGIDRAIMRK